jgi:hypothetical protein
MTRSAVLCLRLCETPKDANNHLEYLRRLVAEQGHYAAKLVGWGADRFSFAFPESERAHVCRLAATLLEELGEHGVGIALREIVVSEGNATRAFGVGLTMAESLANAARPGEVLIDPEMLETPGLTRIGSAVVRFGDVIIRALLCTRSLLSTPRSSPDPLPPLPPLTPPPRPPDTSPTTDPPPALRLSLRPASPAAPPFRSPRVSHRPPPMPEAVRRLSPPPKPSIPPGESARLGAPPPKPSSAPPVEEEPDPASLALATELSSQHSTDPPLRPSIIEALRSGNASSMLALADQLRTGGARGGLVARLEAMASLAQGEVLHGLDSLLAAATNSKQRGSKNQSRTALALAVGLSIAGKKQEALLQGLEALALARLRADDRGERACCAFLGQLARSVGENDVADAWLEQSVRTGSPPSDAPAEADG